MSISRITSDIRVCTKTTEITTYPPEKVGYLLLRPGTLIQLLNLKSRGSSKKCLCKLYDETNEIFNDELHLCSGDDFISIETMWEFFIPIKTKASRISVAHRFDMKETVLEKRKLKFSNVLQNDQITEWNCTRCYCGKVPELGSGMFLGYIVNELVIFESEFKYDFADKYFAPEKPYISIIISADKLFEPISIKMAKPKPVSPPPQPKTTKTSANDYNLRSKNVLPYTRGTTDKKSNDFNYRSKSSISYANVETGINKAMEEMDKSDNRNTSIIGERSKYEENASDRNVIPRKQNDGYYHREFSKNVFPRVQETKPKENYYEDNNKNSITEKSPFNRFNDDATSKTIKSYADIVNDHENVPSRQNKDVDAYNQYLGQGNNINHQSNTKRIEEYIEEKQAKDTTLEDLDLPPGMKIVKCLKEKCQGAWMFDDSSTNLIMCPECKAPNCTKCNVIHEGMTCEQYKEALSAPAKDNNGKWYTISSKKKKEELLYAELKKTDNFGCYYVKEGVCEICGNNSGGIKLKSCFHIVCKKCLKEYIEKKLKTGRVDCPNKKCLMELDSKEIYNLAPNKKALQKYFAAQKQNNNASKCPHCNEYLNAYHAASDVLQCPFCEKKIKIRQIEK